MALHKSFAIDLITFTDMYADKVLQPGYELRSPDYCYRIEEVLGQGSFGITYLATTTTTVAGNLGTMESEITVAIKEFFMRDVNGRQGSMVTASSQDGLFDKYRRKFMGEARNLSRLKHDGIVKVFEIFEVNNTSYYAMEFCKGGSLDDLIALRGALPQDEALAYFVQIAEALLYMHRHKMLHLDLKPGNIMLRAPGRPVLIDFGLSKQYDESGQPESSTSIGGGTPGYAPIEQADYEEGRDFPVTMDVYALGGTLYKMLTGQRPPKASELFANGLPIEPLSSRNVSASVIAAIEKAMEPNKRKRYPTVEEFLKAVNNSARATVVDDESTEIDSKPEPPAEENNDYATLQYDDDQEEPKRRIPWLWISIGAVVAAVAVWWMTAGHGTAISTPEMVDSVAMRLAIDSAKTVEQQPQKQQMPQRQTAQPQKQQPQQQAVEQPLQQPQSIDQDRTEKPGEYDPTRVFTVAEEMPRFPGGDAALMRYLSSHVIYPEVAIENDIQGRVIVQFVVTNTGKVGEVKVVKSVDPFLDREAVRVVQTLPDFIPGKQNGKPVNVWYTLPVTFKLQGLEPEDEQQQAV